MDRFALRASRLGRGRFDAGRGEPLPYNVREGRHNLAKGLGAAARGGGDGTGQGQGEQCHDGERDDEDDHESSLNFRLLNGKYRPKVRALRFIHLDER